MPGVYLDQNKWIDVGRAQHERPGGEPFRAALIYLLGAVEASTVRVPLSAIHYMETMASQNPERRRRLALTMALFSGFVTLAARRLLIAMELDVALAERFGRPTAPRIVDVFGFGAAHAFGSDDLRLQLDWLADLPDGMRGPIEEQARKMAEFTLLAGSGSGLPIPDVDLGALRPLHEGYAERESAIADYLSGLAPTTSANYLDWEEAQDLAPSLNAALPRAGVTPDEFFGLGRDGIVELVASVQSHHILHELRRAHHDNPQMPWDRGHVNDLGALSTAIAYCDVVVTERRWVDLARRRRLDERFGTVLITDVAELPDVLAS